MGLTISTEDEASSLPGEDQEDDPSKSSNETVALEDTYRASAKEAANQNKKTKKARKRAALRTSITRDRLEGARCIACNRVVTPPTIDGFEEHDQVCPAGTECWQHAAGLNALNPDGLLDTPIQLLGGMTGVVVGIVRPRFRRWQPVAHIVQFESGRQDEIVLSDGSRGQQFRLLLKDEVKELGLARQLRLEAELACAKQHAAELSKADRDKTATINKTRRELEDQILCIVCLDKYKTTALVPCGHRTCATCALKCAQCPVCRAEVRHTLRVY